MGAVGRNIVAFIMGAIVFLVVFGVLYLIFGTGMIVWLLSASAGLGAFAGLRSTPEKREPEPPDWPFDVHS